MTSHETTKNALRPKNYHGLEHARAEDNRRQPIVLLAEIPHRPVSYIRSNIPRGVGAPIDKASRPLNGKNYKTYKVFKITTKAMEHRSYAD